MDYKWLAELKEDLSELTLYACVQPDVNAVPDALFLTTDANAALHFNSETEAKIWISQQPRKIALVAREHGFGGK